MEANSIFLDVDQFWRFLAHEEAAGTVLEAIGTSGADIAALVDTLGLHHLYEGFNDILAQAINAHGMQLEDQKTGVLVDDEPVDVDSPEVTEEGFLVTLPDKVRSGQLVELLFDASVFLQGTRFDLFLQDTDQPEDLRQFVDTGDATDLVESSTNVVMLPVSQSLLNQAPHF